MLENNVKYFQVTVKLQEETDKTDRAGNPKLRKWNEVWVVDSKTSEEANKKVQEEYEGSIADWRIASVKETNIIGIL
jgi:hypothetical protein